MKEQVNKQKLILETDCPYKSKTDWKEIPPNKVDTFKTEYGCEVQNCDDGQNYVKCGSCTRNTKYPQGCSSNNTNTGGSGNSGSNGTSSSSGSGNSGSSGSSESIIPTTEDLNVLWNKTKEKAKKLTDPNLPVEIVGGVVDYLTGLGKAVIKKIKNGIPHFEIDGQTILTTPDPGSSSSQGTTEPPKPQPIVYTETKITQDDISEKGAVLKIGVQGDIVSEIQEILLGLKLIDEDYTDGIFDISMKKAIQKFQKDNGLTPTGKVDWKTLEKMRKKAGIDIDLGGTPFGESTKKRRLIEQQIPGTSNFPKFDSNKFNQKFQLPIGSPKTNSNDGNNLDEKNKQQTNLKLALEIGCIPNDLEKGQYITYDNVIHYVGLTKKNYWLAFNGNIGDNGNINVRNITIEKQNKENNTNINSKAIVECPKWKSSIGKVEQLTPEQNAQIDDLIRTDGSYQKEKPSGSDVELKTFKKIDLNDLLSDYFPEKGKHFIYQRTGYKTETPGWYKSTESFLETAGFTLNPPKVGAPENRFGAPISDYFGPNNPSITNVPYKETTYIYPKEASLYIQVPTKEECSSNLNKLYSAFKGGQSIDDKDLPSLKLKVLRCQIAKVFETRFFNENNRKMLSDLVHDRSQYGIRNLMEKNILQTESKKDPLKIIIKESLLNLKSKKNKNLLIEENKIIKNRFQIFKENRNKFQKNKIKFFKELISEIAILQNQGFNDQVVSQNIFDVFTGLFGQKGGQSILERFKEYIIDWLVETTSPMDDSGWVAKSIRYSLNDVSHSEIPKLMNCSFVVKKISTTLNEVIQMKLSSEKNIKNPIDKVIYNSLSDSLSSSDFMSTMESGLSSLICNGIENIANKLQTQSELMTQKAMGS